MPTLSIITVCKNPGAELDKTLASIVPHLNDEIEYLIIDGGSTDGTIKKLQSLPNNIIWISEPDSGIYEAMNKGILLSTGEWILMVNAGDEMMPGFISEFSKFINNNFDEGVIFGIAACYKNSTLIYSAVPNITVNKSQILENFFHPATLIHRNLHFRYGLYSTAFKVISDILFLLKAINNDVKLYPVPFIFTKFYFGGISSGSKIYYQEIKIYKQITKESIFIKNRWLFLAKVILTKTINFIASILKNILLQKSLQIDLSEKLSKNLKSKRQWIRLFNWLINFEKIGASSYLKFSFPKSLMINAMRHTWYQRKREIPVTITLTSFAERFDILEFAIDSLLTQSVSAQEILIWLSPKDLKLLPRHYRRFEKYSIKFLETEDLKAYTKMVPALLSDPKKTYVTVDDDLYYDKNTLFYLYYTHLRHPQAIISFGNDLIKIYSDEIQNFSRWKRPTELASKTIISHRIVPLSGWGTLYPPNCFHAEVNNIRMFQKICPLNDDLWYWGMAVLNGTKIIGLPENLKGNHIDLQEKFRKPETQTLWSINKTANDEQFKNLLTEFSLIKQRLFADKIVAY